MKDVNTSNKEYTHEALQNIKLAINKAIKIQDEKSKVKNILSEFDKTPTSFENSKVIKEYQKSLQENNNENKLDKNEQKENKLKH